MRCADTHTPTMDMNRKTNVYLHCMLSVSFYFILADSFIRLHFIPLALFSIFFIKKNCFFLLRMWMHVTWSDSDALPSPLFSSLLFYFCIWVPHSNFQSLSHSETDRFTYIKIHIVSIFPHLIMLLSAKWARCARPNHWIQSKLDGFVD